MVTDIVILGAGGLAREVAFLIEEINRCKMTWNLLGFVERDAREVGRIEGQYSVIAAESELVTWKVAAVIANGRPARIREMHSKVGDYSGLSFPNLIHPSIIWDEKSVTLGQGNIIFPGVIFTVNIRIGSFNVFSLNSCYGHDVEIGDYCVFNPGVQIGGGVVVGSGALIGMGAQVYQYRTIGPDSTVGMGSAVIANVREKTTVLGVPAQVLRKPEG